MPKNRKLRATWVKDLKTGKVDQARSLSTAVYRAGYWRKDVEIDGETVEVISGSKNGLFAVPETA